MRPLMRPLLACFTSLSAACSTTPGDAARRSGHPEAAAKLYEKGAAQGDAVAARKLAELYHYRAGLAEDRQQAIKWYQRAFELGDISAAWEIGMLYNDGKGNVPRDAAQAAQWFEKGAAAGHHYAMYALADLHTEDAVAPRDDVRGLMWLNAVTMFVHKVAKKNAGHQYVLDDPKKVRSRLETRMSSAEIAQALKRAEEWVTRYESATR